MRVLIIDGQDGMPNTDLPGVAERALVDSADLIVGVHINSAGKLIADTLKAVGPVELDVVEWSS